MDRFIYLTIKDNESDFDELNQPWPDIFTFPINKFKYTVAPEEIVLTEQYIQRMDLLMYDKYDITDYDDIVLWLNNVEYKTDLVPGQKFLLPDKNDLERFYVTYII